MTDGPPAAPPVLSLTDPLNGGPRHDDRLYAEQVERYAAEFGALFMRTRVQAAELEVATLAVVNAFVVALGAHDPYTREHTVRVQEAALRTARVLGWREEDLEEVRLGAVLHDIGKTSISDRILCKPGRLTDEEYREIQRHPGIGSHMLSGFPSLAVARPYVLAHHERWDGLGYPNRLRGREIPLQGRLLAVADAVDAMLCDRPYRPALSLPQVLDELRAGSGRQFDPGMVEAYLASGALELYADRLAVSGGDAAAAGAVGVRQTVET